MNALRDSVDKRHRFLLALCAGPLTRIEVYGYRRSGFLLDSDLEWLLSVAPGGSNAAPDLNAESLCNLIGAHSSSTMSLISRLFTPRPSAGRRCARATPSACVSISRKSRMHGNSRRDCARGRTTVLPRSRSTRPAKFSRGSRKPKRAAGRRGGSSLIIRC